MVVSLSAWLCSDVFSMSCLFRACGENNQENRALLTCNESSLLYQILSFYTWEPAFIVLPADIISIGNFWRWRDGICVGSLRNLYQRHQTLAWWRPRDVMFWRGDHFWPWPETHQNDINHKQIVKAECLSARRLNYNVSPSILLLLWWAATT